MDIMEYLLLWKNLQIAIFAVGIVFVVVTQLMLLHRIRKMAANMEKAYEEAQRYVNYILNDAEEERDPETGEQAKSTRMNPQEQNQLITSVLGEIFP